MTQPATRADHASPGHPALGGFDRNLRAVALSGLVGQGLRMLSSKPRRDDLKTLRGFLEAGSRPAFSMAWTPWSE